jgi:hypothetical protein
MPRESYRKTELCEPETQCLQNGVSGNLPGPDPSGPTNLFRTVGKTSGLVPRFPVARFPPRFPIAAVLAEARTAASTDWRQIAALYTPAAWYPAVPRGGTEPRSCHRHAGRSGERPSSHRGLAGAQGTGRLLSRALCPGRVVPQAETAGGGPCFV